MTRILGIDIGGTTTRVAAFPSSDSTVSTPLVSFPTEPDYDAQIVWLARVLRDTGSEPLAGIGVSLGGRIARDGQSVSVAPNLPGYVERPLVADLAAIARCPVRLAHDAVCGLLAEKRLGALRPEDRCAYLTVSTGTGCALHLGNDQNAVMLSIEFAHQILDGNTRICLCGQTGCLETYTGGKQLTLRYGLPPEEIHDAQVWRDFTEKLALGIVNLTQLTRVETIALSGGIALNRLRLLDDTQRRVSSMLRGTDLRLVRAALGEQAPLIGAALLLDTPEGRILH